MSAKGFVFPTPVPPYSVMDQSEHRRRPSWPSSLPLRDDPFSFSPLASPHSPPTPSRSVNSHGGLPRYSSATKRRQFVDTRISLERNLRNISPLLVTVTIVLVCVSCVVFLSSSLGDSTSLHVKTHGRIGNPLTPRLAERLMIAHSLRLRASEQAQARKNRIVPGSESQIQNTFDLTHAYAQARQEGSRVGRGRAAPRLPPVVDSEAVIENAQAVLQASYDAPLPKEGISGIGGGKYRGAPVVKDRYIPGRLRGGVAGADRLAPIEPDVHIHDDHDRHDHTVIVPLTPKRKVMNFGAAKKGMSETMKGEVVPSIPVDHEEDKRSTDVQDFEDDEEFEEEEEIEEGEEDSVDGDDEDEDEGDE